MCFILPSSSLCSYYFSTYISLIQRNIELPSSQVQITFNEFIRQLRNQTKKYGIASIKINKNLLIHLSFNKCKSYFINFHVIKQPHNLKYLSFKWEIYGFSYFKNQKGLNRVMIEGENNSKPKLPNNNNDETEPTHQDEMEPTHQDFKDVKREIERGH